jgi:hypothetical protein
MTPFVLNKAPNAGRLHAVKCEWCRLKMACNCMFDDIREDERRGHPLVMCPRCQVTEFLNLLFGKGQTTSDDTAAEVREREK